MVPVILALAVGPLGFGLGSGSGNGEDAQAAVTAVPGGLGEVGVLGLAGAVEQGSEYPLDRAPAAPRGQGGPRTGPSGAGHRVAVAGDGVNDSAALAAADLAWAFGYNLVTVPLVMAGLLDPKVAAPCRRAHLVVGNSLRPCAWQPPARRPRRR